LWGVAAARGGFNTATYPRAAEGAVDQAPGVTGAGRGGQPGEDQAANDGLGGDDEDEMDIGGAW
jgi:hypothetical protein